MLTPPLDFIVILDNMLLPSLHLHTHTHTQGCKNLILINLNLSHLLAGGVVHLDPHFERTLSIVTLCNFWPFPFD